MLAINSSQGAGDGLLPFFSLSLTALQKLAGTAETPLWAAALPSRGLAEQ
jgi:hypothetical protein